MFDIFQAFRDLQNSVRDGVVLFRALLEEIKTNAESEKIAIETLCTDLLQKIEETKTMLLQNVHRLVVLFILIVVS